MSENTAAPLPEKPKSKGKQESKFPMGMVVRLFAYLIAGHILAGFLYLLFEMGGK
ncbi:hypothetical protein GCM10010387_30430 [Streptomyces inusitatus]|uniref:Small hydrophobic protein n=1 Tax=Streptomyces inusitatus TaxID=68221 RepID=A0A918UUJ8_9ACTN|nr:DUF6126 family protein [Streptomyces inusitatus]GGZ34116.1 hypothetical protein GCM10010387_30430 [Streptomyces inusitatus]